MSRFVRSAGLVVAAALVTGCGTQPVVGVLVADSGAASPYGASMRRGIELGLESAPAAADGSVQVVWADSASDPETARARARSLVQESGATLLVPAITSGEAAAVLEVLEEQDAVGLSPSASAPGLTRSSRRFFRLFPSDELEGRRAGRFLREEKGASDVIVLAAGSEQAQGIEPPFREMYESALEGRVVSRVVIGEPGWEERARQALAADPPDAAYVIGYIEDTVAAVAVLRDQGFQGPICVTSAAVNGERLAREPERLAGVFVPLPAFDVDSEVVAIREFVASYRSRYGADPDIYAAHAYDAIRLALQVATDAAVFESAEIRKQLQFGIEEFPGVTGVIRFTEYGDVHRNPIMFIVADGGLDNYEEYLKRERAAIRERIRRLLAS